MLSQAGKLTLYSFGSSIAAAIGAGALAPMLATTRDGKQATHVVGFVLGYALGKFYGTRMAVAGTGLAPLKTALLLTAGDLAGEGVASYLTGGVGPGGISIAGKTKPWQWMSGGLVGTYAVARYLTKDLPPETLPAETES